MSNQSSRDHRPATTSESSDGQEPDPRVLEQYLPSLAKPIRTASFWLAIVLPFLYVPLLVIGLSSAVETGTFLGLLLLNLVVLYVGHSYRQ